MKSSEEVFVVTSLRFQLIKEHLVEFNQLAAAHAEGSEDMLNRVMLRDNIGIMALLENVESSTKEKIVVTNAHIHWDPEFKDVKLIQVVMLMRELTRFMHEYAPSSSGKGMLSLFGFVLIVLFPVHIRAFAHCKKFPCGLGTISSHMKSEIRIM